MNHRKKQIVKISVFITSLFVIFLSVTYAFINQTLVGEKRQVITAGNLDLELLEGENNLTIQDAMPMYDEVGMIQEAFTFQLVNKVGTDTNYIIKLVDITTGDRLDTSIVKYGLTKDDDTKINLISSLFESRLDTGIIRGNQTIHYALRLWIDSDVTNDTLIAGKSLNFRIDVEVSQKVELNPSGTLCSSNDENFNFLLESVPIIRFENKIDIPNTITQEDQQDVSEMKDQSVMAYLERDENGDTAVLHVQGNGGIYLPEDSSNLLSFLSINTIEGLEYLDTSKVITMEGLFSGSTIENLDFSILQWDTSNVTNVSNMFGSCKIQNLNLAGFDTSHVTNMSGMFGGNGFYVSNLDLTGLDTSSVVDMYGMFSMATLDSVNLRISDWDVSNVEDMGSMFSEATIKSLDIRNWNASKVADISLMFLGATIETLNLSDSNFSSAMDMSEMFSFFTGTKVNLNRIDISSVETCRRMFVSSAIDEIHLSDWNMQNITDMSEMFQLGHIKNITFVHWDTSSVINMSNMFYACESLTNLDLSSFNTSNVTNMESMFYGCRNLTNLDLSSFDTSNVTYMETIFVGCESLTSLDLSNFVIQDGVTLVFSGLRSLQRLDIHNFDVATVENLSLHAGEIVNSCLILVKDQLVKDYLVSFEYTNVVIESA